MDPLEIGAYEGRYSGSPTNTIIQFNTGDEI
jgi:hypothetical protein